MSDLFKAAAESVSQLTDGQFVLEADESGTAYLVKTKTQERVQLPPPNGYALSNAGRLNRIGTLSVRERQVFEMLGNGLDMNDIAERMQVSAKTVETYRARIKQKLDVSQRNRLLALAVEYRLARASLANGEILA